MSIIYMLGGWLTSVVLVLLFLKGATRKNDPTGALRRGTDGN